MVHTADIPVTMVAIHTTRSRRTVSAMEVQTRVRITVPEPIVTSVIRAPAPMVVRLPCHVAPATFVLDQVPVHTMVVPSLVRPITTVSTSAITTIAIAAISAQQQHRTCVPMVVICTATARTVSVPVVVP